MGLGVLLLLGIFSRIIALIAIPLTMAFMANNIWALAHGLETFPGCAYCFGIWEEFLGTISPVVALIIDIVLFGLALVVLVFYQEGFFTFRPWFIKNKAGERT